MFNNQEMQLILNAIVFYVANGGQDSVTNTYLNQLKIKINLNYIGLIDSSEVVD
jgi:hypothetical protein